MELNKETWKVCMFQEQGKMNVEMCQNEFIYSESNGDEFYPMKNEMLRKMLLRHK